MVMTNETGKNGGITAQIRGEERNEGNWNEG
jgi:hypothetical protein